MCLKMSAVGVGLALAATGAVFVILPVVKDQLNSIFTPTMVDGANVSSNVSYLDPNGTDVQYVLFTRNNPPQNLKIGDLKGLKNSGFNASNPTKLIIHGYTSSIMEEIFTINKNAYLQVGPHNVIGVDWSVLCESEYFSAMRGVKMAGRELGKFINWLSKHGNAPLGDMHIVGHSLGAHVAGIAGDVVKGKVGRITGLDPAGPGFTELPADCRLDAGDAKLVDVVHTFMKVLSFAEPLGHVDFYPNGGRFQPGCPDIYDVWNIAESLQCNHARAYYLFAESIRKNHTFKSKRCKTVNDALEGKCYQDAGVYMGHADTYKNGLYYFKTKAKKPYSLS